jgi:hypothetical protein
MSQTNNYTGAAKATKSKTSSKKNKSQHPNPVAEVTPTPTMVAEQEQQQESMGLPVLVSRGPLKVNLKSMILMRRLWRRNTSPGPLIEIRPENAPVCIVVWLQLGD